MSMKGWKTSTGAGLLALGAILSAFGETQAGEAVIGVGVALGVIGVGHKIEKAGSAVSEAQHEAVARLVK